MLNTILALLAVLAVMAAHALYKLVRLPFPAPAWPIPAQPQACSGGSSLIDLVSSSPAALRIGLRW